MKMGRMTTGLIMTAVMLVVWAVQGPVMRVLFAAMNLLCVWEMYGALRAKGLRPVRWVGLSYAALSMPAYVLGGAELILPLTALACIAGFTAVILRGEVDFDAVIGTLTPVFYPGLLTAMIYPIQDMVNPLLSTIAIGLTFLISAASDIAAYCVGRRWGKRKLAPALSPKKTIEGAIGGLAGAAAMSALLPVIFRSVSPAVAAWAPYADTIPGTGLFVLLGLIAGAAAAVGDLAASLIKRACGIKDYGNLLPGHGGMLDRIDSVLFCGTVVYTFFLLIA